MELETTPTFDGWMARLRDTVGRARIQARIDRLIDGNPGQHRVLIGGVCEMKIDVGPGYRIYYTQRRKVLIILLAGGSKATQRGDIRMAVLLAQKLEESNDG
jgi:putative addiction module killer protein